MRFFYIINLSFLFFACTSKDRQVSSQNVDVNKKNDTVFNKLTNISLNSDSIDWQEGFGLTHDPNVDSIWFKPVSFYLSNKACSPLAKDFYYGKLRPSDDNITDSLLNLAVTNNNELRPFYRWCLNKTIVIQDGALGEHTGIPARRYAEKFPKEFFEYMDIDTSGNKYLDWVNSILYSGFYEEDDYKKSQEIAKRMGDRMKLNCKGCNKETIKRIDKLVQDCFK